MDATRMKRLTRVASITSAVGIVLVAAGVLAPGSSWLWNLLIWSGLCVLTVGIVLHIADLAITIHEMPE